MKLKATTMAAAAPTTAVTARATQYTNDEEKKMNSNEIEII